ncbi:hypothetical protein IIA79_07150 [bacterium]|nr:hypothetical protein [bacterium]
MLKWIIIGLVLTFIWYVLAPFFTPASLRGRKPGGKAKGKHAGKGENFEVIDGKGRIIK